MTCVYGSQVANLTLHAVLARMSVIRFQIPIGCTGTHGILTAAPEAFAVRLIANGLGDWVQSSIKAVLLTSHFFHRQGNIMPTVWPIQLRHLQSQWIPRPYLSRVDLYRHLDGGSPFHSQHADINCSTTKRSRGYFLRLGDQSVNNEAWLILRN